MHSLEFQVVLNSPLETVFAVYVDTERWTNRNQLCDIRWTHGKPWAKGSRLRVETLAPISLSVDQVVQHFEPPHSVVFAQPNAWSHLRDLRRLHSGDQNADCYQHRC